MTSWHHVTQILSPFFTSFSVCTNPIIQDKKKHTYYIKIQYNKDIWYSYTYMNIPDVFCVSVPWTFAQRFALSPQFESVVLTNKNITTPVSWQIQTMMANHGAYFKRNQFMFERLMFSMNCLIFSGTLFQLICDVNEWAILWWCPRAPTTYKRGEVTSKSRVK